MADLPRQLQGKHERFLELLRGCTRLAVAYSGGVDSTYLLYEAAQVLGRENVLGILAEGQAAPEEELAHARHLGRRGVG